jgi:hypothetical protein
MQNDQLSERMVTALQPVPGMAAIVLGGSRGRGTATEASDHDFGLYYEPDAPIDVTALRAAVAPLLDDPATTTITPIGEWGPRINGGAWLTVGGRKVDLLYRDLGRVRTIVDECKAGHIVMDYQPGHPHGFCSAIYAGEVATCRPLHDPAGVVARLKRELAPFPIALRDAIVLKFRWEVRFCIDNAALAVKRSDQTHVAGSAYRALCCIAQVLFAANGRYLINEKGALAEAARFPLTIAGLDESVAEVWRAIGARDFARALAVLGVLADGLDAVVAGSGG